MEQGKKARPYLTFVKGDALKLSFKENEFDVTTISFGLRNTKDYRAALREALRVTKEGGRIVIVEFSTPTFPIFRKLYMNYLMKSLPKIARKTSSNPVAYEYLAESIRAWPDQGELAREMSASGWKDPEWTNLTGGVVAVHTGIKRS